eukprot:15402661-Heterocapsa_arctica.AAC.1
MYFWQMHRSYHLLGTLLDVRTSAGADAAELDQIHIMRCDVYCEAVATLAMIREVSRHRP